MSCCTPAVALVDTTIDRRRAADDELLLASRDIGGGLRQSGLSSRLSIAAAASQKSKNARRLAGGRAGTCQSLDQAVTIHWRAMASRLPS
jgi:hypothetical protein